MLEKLGPTKEQCKVGASCYAAAQLAALIESTRDVIWAVDRNYGLIAFNRALTDHIARYGIHTAVGMGPFDLLPPEEAALWPPLYERALNEGAFRSELLLPDGRCLELSFSQMFQDGQLIGVSVFGKDITERKAAAEALRQAEHKFREIFEEAPEGIFQISKEGRALALNPSGASLLGYASSEDGVAAIEDSAHDAWFIPKERARYVEIVERDGQIHDFPCLFKRVDGTPVPVSISARKVCGADGQTLYYQGFIEDITEQKRLEAALKAKVREVQMLSEINSALLRAKTKEDLLLDYCRILVEVGGYRMAWVGFAENGPDKRIVPAAHYGHEDGYLNVIDVHWGDTERGNGPTGRSIKTGAVQVVEEIGSDPLMKPWHSEAAKRGYRSSIALPFSHSDGAMACLTAYGEMSSAWTESERKLMEQVAQDLGFGISTLRMEIAKNRYQEDLRVSLEETIQVIAGTVDQRDPYTAGHQRRVADLCTHIAAKMGLSEDCTLGLHLAASIHDLGKIGIPAELLSKPGRLSAPQFNLIKEHAQLGYEIIKNVHFPWPIGDIILQHHERLDGTGYPLKLKAEATLLESKVLAVADVVEAMSSHRPYRPALGIDVALDEILAKSGTLYDPEVAAACVRIFRENGYKFPA